MAEIKAKTTRVTPVDAHGVPTGPSLEVVVLTISVDADHVLAAFNAASRAIVAIAAQIPDEIDSVGEIRARVCNDGSCPSQGCLRIGRVEVTCTHPEHARQARLDEFERMQERQRTKDLVDGDGNIVGVYLGHDGDHRFEDGQCVLCGILDLGIVR